MPDELSDREPPRTSAARGGRFKPHALGLADGGQLVLGADGSIDRLDDSGSTVERWAPDDPDWPDQAIRFGLRPQAQTVRPQGPVQGTKPPRR